MLSARIALVVVLAGSMSACGGGGGGGSDAGNGASGVATGSGTPSFANEPVLQSSQTALDESLNCTPFEHPDKPPVLLVHGTSVTGPTQYTFFYAPQLIERGFDVCIVTYPDRGLGDMQTSAEYVVNALRIMHAQTGRKVALIGHSQGALMPRWAVRFFPSAREAIGDYVSIAGPNHGTVVSLSGTIGETLLSTLGLTQLPVGTQPEVIYQFPPGSNFVAAVNSVDETPGDIEYTSLYTQYDQLVRPVETADLDPGLDNPKVSNILLQDVCPAHLSEHFSIGTSDTLAFALALDAISNPGPADIERAGGPSELCGLLPFDPAEFVRPEAAEQLLTVVVDTVETGITDLHLANEEPPLRDYVDTEVLVGE